MLVRRAVSPVASAASRSSGAMPERITWASRGPMPFTAISFSNSCFSRSLQKP
jgi:hypothetical protein